MNKLEILQFIREHIEQNPGWKYDILTDAYAHSYLVFEVSQLLEPKGADYLDIEDMVSVYIHRWRNHFKELSASDRSKIADVFERIGLDFDRAELLAM